LHDHEVGPQSHDYFDVRLEIRADSRSCVRFRRVMAVLRHGDNAVPQPEREQTWSEIETALREFEGPDGFVGPCELLVGAGTN
jgi:hypothetical protein